MLLGDKPLIFKVDPVSTGSDALVVGTEGCHRETKFRPTSICTKMKSYSSTRVRCALLWLACEYDAGTGSQSFHLAGGWIGVANVSSEPATILTFFNKPALSNAY